MTLSVQITHRFSTFALDVRFDAPAGVTVLFGRSGSGKTSVVHAMAGLLRPQHARIVLDDDVLVDTQRGVWVPPHHRRLGVVFQESRLFPHLDVEQNLRYGHRGASPGQAESWSRVIEILGIGHLLRRRPGALSGGERQRVAIGRALLSGPRMILADEPLASLDEARKAEILRLFERLRDEISVPIVYVSHSPTEVARLATTVVVLEQGRVHRAGPALDVLGDPGVMPLGIRGVGAVLETTVRCHHDDGLSELAAGTETLLLPRVPQAVGEHIRVRIPAQEVIVALKVPQAISALNVLAATVESVREGAGPGALVVASTGAGRVLARITRRSALALGLVEGSRCFLIVKTVAIAPEDIGGARP
ncbi:MAG: molybdenum ABC transporter ATP-binding protein [Burkholderiaceae bacterium]